MSDESSDGSLEIRRAPRTGAGAAAAGRISSLSDDDSEDERPPVPQQVSRATSASPSDREDENERENDRPDEDDRESFENRRERDTLPAPADMHVRSAGIQGARVDSVDLFHFPPTISFPPRLTTTLENLPDEQNPILYRLKPGIEKEKPATEVFLKAYRKSQNIMDLKDILQSNANLITWSDGSKTIAIGSQQFLLIEDAMASKQFVFRRGDKIQTCEAGVNSVARVQPSSTGDASAKYALATAAANRSASKRPPARTMLRCMDDDAEQQEAKAKVVSNRKERERARMEAKRRQTRERHARPSRALAVEVLESENESEDDHVRRIEERVDADRLRRAKRAASSSRTVDVPVKRRKAGGRRVLGSDEDDSDESE